LKEIILNKWRHQQPLLSKKEVRKMGEWGSTPSVMGHSGGKVTSGLG